MGENLFKKMTISDLQPREHISIITDNFLDGVETPHAPQPQMEEIPLDMNVRSYSLHRGVTIPSILSMFSVFTDPLLGSPFDFDLGLEEALDDCLLQANIRLQCERGVRLKADKKHRRRMKKWKNYKF